MSAVAILSAVAFVSVTAGSGPPAAHGASPPKSNDKHSKRAQQQARQRRAFDRQLRHNPALILQRGFLKQASLAGFRLPLTVRLTDGNGVLDPTGSQLEITWDDSVTPWPSGGAAPATQTTSLTGKFSMELSYGDDASGYGELGSLESLQGASLRMKASPFTISEFAPTCPSGPQLRVPAAGIDVSSAGSRYGLLNPFSQRFRGSLLLRMTFAAETPSGCGGAYAATPVVDNSAAPPMPLRFDGRFRTSPAITADGKVRFGEITVDDSITPQLTTFAYVRSCTGVLTCNAVSFPARLKLKKLTAEVLLGDIGP
jgi:hypothetical protein